MNKKTPYPTTYSHVRGKAKMDLEDGIKTPSRPELAAWWAGRMNDYPEPEEKTGRTGRTVLPTKTEDEDETTASSSSRRAR